MDRNQDTAGKAKSTDKDGATKGADARAQGKVKFDKPLGSARNDEADMRDVAQEARAKSK
jgi:hypothetical protein